jgi:hypothetical protein
MSARIVIDYLDDETVEVRVLGGGEPTSIQLATHDEHGWDGIEAIVETAERIGDALGVKVERL